MYFFKLYINLIHFFYWTTLQNDFQETATVSILLKNYLAIDKQTIPTVLHKIINVVIVFKTLKHRSELRLFCCTEIYSALHLKKTKGQDLSRAEFALGTAEKNKEL